MSEEKRGSCPAPDEDVQREVLRERRFSMQEAIGRMAGPGMLKGESPVTRKRQAAAMIQEYLTRNLPDADGVLRGVLLCHVRESEALLGALDQPIAALGAYVRAVLGSEYLLTELVREADREWGRQFSERPHFERPGQDPHPDDPYTVAGVQASLSRLLEGIEAGQG